MITKQNTQKSFIKAFLSHTPITSTQDQIYAQLKGMAKWQKIIGSTPPQWFDVDDLNYKIHRAREKTPRTKPALETKIYMEEINR
jgi:hypothetical protein